jgi:hypothetical protein
MEGEGSKLYGTNPKEMTNRPDNSQPKGFMGSSLFKVMIVVLLAALGAYYFFRYSSKEDTAPSEPVGSESALSEAEHAPAPVEAEAPVIESTTIYEYKETGNTFTLVDDGGPGPYEFTCTSIATINSSSVLAAQGTSSYATTNMTDMAESTAWSEGKDGLGVGEWIEFTLTDEYKKWGYTDNDFIANKVFGEFVIQTGYAKSPSAWKRNNRPIKLKSYLNGHPVSVIQLQDSPNFQTFGIFPSNTERPRLGVGDVIRFEILKVVQGTSSKDSDTCISEFHIAADCG